MNCDAAFRNGKAAIALVAHDNFGLLVTASSNINICFSAFEAEAKGVDWAISYVLSKMWRNPIFSFDASFVMEDVSSPKRHDGWSASESIQSIKSTLDYTS